MTTEEWRTRSIPELRQEIERLRKEQFTLRVQKASGQLGQSHLIRGARRDVARVKTIMTEKSRNG